MRQELANKLLRCLKCRLTGSPPQFNLPPPPPPQAFIDSFIYDPSNNKSNKFDFTNSNEDNLIHHCLCFKEIFYPSAPQTDICTILKICTIIFIIGVILVKLIKIKKHLNKYQSDSLIGKPLLVHSNENTIKNSWGYGSFKINNSS